MTDGNSKQTTNRRTVLKKVTATGAAIGAFTQVGTAEAADKNGQHYCHEKEGGYARCRPKFEPGTRVVVDGPDDVDGSDDGDVSQIGTWETCCIMEDCSEWKIVSPFHSVCTDNCHEAGWRFDGDTGTVRGTCEHSDLVLVEWDDAVEWDQKKSHIADFAISTVHDRDPRTVSGSRRPSQRGAYY